MLKCAFYEKEITPPLGCHIPGYFSLRAATDVKDRLFSRAMVIKSDSETVAIVSVDACTVDYAILNPAKERITEFTGIPESNILFAYTHSHTAIPRSFEKKSEESWAMQEGYHTVFSKLIADCAILAYKRLEDCTFYFSKGEVNGISFCRDYYMKDSTPRTNPPRTSPDILGPTGETDNELPILFVKDKAGTPKGAIISFACHPDCVDGSEYSGDYISELTNKLKKVYGPDFVVVFLAGTCGDINHFDVSKKSDSPDHYKMMGSMLAGEAVKSIAQAKEIDSDKLVCKYEVMKINRRFVPEDVINDAKHKIETIKEIPGVKIAADNSDPDQYNLSMAKRLMNFLNTIPEVCDVPVQFIMIGDVKIYAFTSEIYCYFGKLIKEASNTPKTFVVTHSNGTFGYVPTRDLFYDTIYESRAGSNQLDKEAGYIMAEKLIEMGK